ncbi:MAG TPA: CAP domain-containing protein [Kofleriaceae bacterium]|nr:CAP domain-containing protein [Kofleriaceae bacterium]
MKAIALLLLVLAACGPKTTRVGTQPSWRGHSTPTQVIPMTFAPTTDAAVRYNERLEAPPPSPLGDAVLQSVREVAVRLNLPAPAADARLFTACQELAQVVPEEGIIGYSVVEFALQRHGIIEPSPHLLVVWGNIDEPQLIVDQLKPRLPEILGEGTMARVGIGAAKRNADGTGAVVFAMQASGVATNPIPRTLPANGSFKLDAVVDSRYHEPELFITREDGSTERMGIELGKSGGFKAMVLCGKHIGKQQVEITASDQSGSTVLANFPVWCASEPPQSITIEGTQEDNAVVGAEEAERRLLALMNRDRQAAGLPALLWDERVAQVSRAHSEDMRRTKIVAHISPTTGSAADRVKVAGIKTAVVLENVARAYGVGEAHLGLMNSPGHRANILAAAATHVGVGVILGDDISGRREMFLTQVFIRIPPKVDRAQAADLVRERINAVRPVSVNVKLAGVAQDLAEGLAAGKTRESLWPGAKKKLDGLNTSYARVGSVISAVADLETVDGKQLLGDYKADDIGVGIAQGNHPDIGEGAVWVVVLMAEKLPAPKK